MSRLTYHDRDGSWGLLGIPWKALVELPAPVYGALCKLKDVEDLIDEATSGVDERAVEELLSKGSDGMEGRRRAEKWIMQRVGGPDREK